MENPHAGTVSDEQLLAGFREQLRLETQELIPVEPIMSMQNDSEKMVCLLPHVFRRMREGYVFTGVCLSTVGVPPSPPLVRGSSPPPLPTPTPLHRNRKDVRVAPPPPPLHRNRGGCTARAVCLLRLRRRTILVCVTKDT